MVSAAERKLVRKAKKIINTFREIMAVQISRRNKKGLDEDEDEDEEDLQADINMVRATLDSLYTREKGKEIMFRGNSPQNDHRKYVSKLIFTIGRKYRLQHASMFLGIRLYNYFQDVHEINKAQIHLVGLTSLYLAMKIHETETYPQMCTLKKYIPSMSDFNSSLFLQIEKMILKFYDWNVLFPTIYDFIEVFIEVSLDDIDILQEVGRCGESIDEVKRLLDQLCTDNELRRLYLKRQLSEVEYKIKGVINIIMLEEPSSVFEPSLIASGILMLARLSLGYHRWAKRQEEITRYEFRQVLQCINRYLLTFDDIVDCLNLNTNHIPSSVIEADLEFLAPPGPEPITPPKQISAAWPPPINGDEAEGSSSGTEDSDGMNEIIMRTQSGTKRRCGDDDDEVPGCSRSNGTGPSNSKNTNISRGGSSISLMSISS